MDGELSTSWFWTSGVGVQKSDYSHAEHILGLGHMNVMADQESRYLMDSSDWKLDIKFSTVSNSFSVGLFAPRSKSSAVKKQIH